MDFLRPLGMKNGCGLTVVIAFFAATVAEAAPVNLNTWTAESYDAVSGFLPGIWQVGGGGSTVTQINNGQPTLFYSDFQAINTFNQAEVLEGTSRQVLCSGQTSIGADGAVQHPNELRPQITAALDNLEEVLKGAGMSFGNVVRLTIYTTDVDEMIANWDALAGRLAAANVAPPQTLLGVARLAFAELKVEIEATAAD